MLGLVMVSLDGAYCVYMEDSVCLPITQSHNHTTQLINTTTFNNLTVQAQVLQDYFSFDTIDCFKMTKNNVRMRRRVCVTAMTTESILTKFCT